MQKSLNVLDFERSLAELDKNITAYESAASERGQDYTAVIDDLKKTRRRLLAEIFANLTPWDEVLLARKSERPYSLDYIKLIFDDFTELHGDRLSSDDQSIVCGPARLNGRSVMVVAQQKGRDLKERTLRNFGYPRPDGYRKALRVMKLAEKVGIPVVTLIDCPGADTNLGSEERGISSAIAVNLMEMSVLGTPIVACVIGEGGSGGALGIAVADRILILEHAVYSVIPPEGCAAILDTFGRDPNRKDEAAAALKLTAKSVLELGIVDEVLPEPLGGAHTNVEETADTLKAALIRHLGEIEKLPISELVDLRYEKFRRLGIYDEIPELDEPSL
ncbi:MAG: acetyl-CoA carboxylase carboxyltransferase subunit alpha [Capsulimonadaceae bacterium]|nr:acetyl-CoA carboxylase carboxyltransferase subunit alpha [Capsulimonadaceae bacterium]